MGNAVRPPALAGEGASPAVRQVLRSDAMRVVLAVAELGSVRGAAEALAMTPSAVSKQLRRVEEQLGRRLFERTRAGISPNGEGEALAVYARRFLALVGEVGERFDRELVTGRVRVGVTDDVGLARIPAVLRRCQALFPGIAVELTVAWSSELVALSAARRLDLAILSDGGPAFPDGAVPLRPEPMVWAARAGAAMADPLPVAVAAEGCRWRRRALEALEQSGRPFEIACTSTATAGQLAAVRVGLAVAPLPASVIAGEGEIEPARGALPALPDCRLALVASGGPSRAVDGVAAELVRAFGAA